MARIDSTRILAKEIVGDLQVIPIFNEIMRVSVGKDSIYTTTKDTLQEFFSGSSMNDTEKATILSQTLIGMTSNLTTKAMDTAVIIAKENREGDLSITKLREEILHIKEQTDLVAAQNSKVVADIASVEYDSKYKVIQGWKTQADIVRDNGVVLANLPALTSSLLPTNAVSDTGIKYSQELQSKATAHAVYAKSIRESGELSYTTSSNGALVTASQVVGGFEGLTSAQTNVAIRQEAAFEDNKRQHAINSSAAMMGMLVSAGESALINGDITALPGSPLALWDDAATYLTTNTAI